MYRNKQKSMKMQNLKLLNHTYVLKVLCMQLRECYGVYLCICCANCMCVSVYFFVCMILLLFLINLSVSVSITGRKTD